MEAEVERRNLELSEIYDEIDSLLLATLEVDDHVDLDTLRIVVTHPPFHRADLETPTPAPGPILDPPAPILAMPEPPKGLLGGLFGKKAHAKAVAEATADHQSAMAQWQRMLEQQELRRRAAAEQHARAEVQRLEALQVERARYIAACEAREAEAARHNAEIDQLIANLGYGTVDAVQEYISIVLSNSAYPSHFSVDHEFSFDPTTAELRLRVTVPPPSSIPDIKAYKYKKSSDEITSTNLSKKACKDRYANAVHQVALRSLHEVFESDRRGLIKTITLEVGAQTSDPATGRETFLPFVAIGSERDSFLELNLSNVVPSATLVHLGAATSKNPYELVTIDPSGVRRS
ncbi:MAG: hypothetical protein KDK70_01695 [Myxococcales bacterium]|nr:hypothetical protein [Myxococcales bacterium]